MSNAEKTIDRRDEIAQVAPGAVNLADFRKQASKQDWPVDPSELRKWAKAAEERLMRKAKGDYGTFDAESLKMTAVQQALRTLGTGVDLKGSLDPSAALLATPSSDPFQRAVVADSPVNRRERVVRRLAAEAKDDKFGLQLVEHATPDRFYRWPDTTLPIQLLDILTSNYLIEQLDRAALVANSLFCSALQPDDLFWDFVGLLNAYQFRVGREGWQQFCQGLGLDPDYLMTRNHHSVMLENYSQKICDIAPSLEEAREMLEKHGHTVETIITAESVAQAWREGFLVIFEDSDQKKR
jgi:hypothetical protein